jgi:hypothetical protein
VKWSKLLTVCVEAHIQIRVPVGLMIIQHGKHHEGMQAFAVSSFHNVKVPADAASADVEMMMNDGGTNSTYIKIDICEGLWNRLLTYIVWNCLYHCFEIFNNSRFFHKIKAFYILVLQISMLGESVTTAWCILGLRKEGWLPAMEIH